MNGLHRTPDQIKHRQNVCTELMSAILESSDNGDLSLLETVIDEYIYKCNEDELEELEDIIVNQYGYDEEPGYVVK
tara:strand:+ start:336 stop:563 length:228 start_codon:yes stop_codon:yes gene_type:complete